MRQNSQELALLSAIQLDADQPISTIAKKTGLRSHTIHYHLRRLKERGIIRRGALINLAALKFQQFAVYFSLAPTSAKSKARLLSDLRKHPRILWFAELGGDYQYGMSIIATRAEEAVAFLSSLAAKGDCHFMHKAVSLIVKSTLFRKKYLNPSQKVTEQDYVSAPSQKTDPKADDKDMKILGLLSEGKGDSIQALAKELGAPRTTVEYRIKRMKDENILLRSIYYVSASKLGYQVFKLLIYTRGLNPSLERELFNFAHKHPYIVYYVSNFGSWDFEITVEGDGPKVAVSVTEALYEHFSENLHEIRILPVFEQTTSTGFLKL